MNIGGNSRGRDRGRGTAGGNRFPMGAESSWGYLMGGSAGRGITGGNSRGGEGIAGEGRIAGGE